MERIVAIKKLGKLLGKSLGYRVDPNAPTAEEREASQLELRIASAEKRRIDELKEARFRAILAADPEYQNLLADWRVARDRVGKLASAMNHYKITVGTTSEMFFHVKAQGDSWEEVIEKLTAKQNA
jgi:hypothetical protein